MVVKSKVKKYKARLLGSKKWKTVEADEPCFAAEIFAEEEVCAPCIVFVKGHGSYSVESHLEFFAIKIMEERKINETYNFKKVD